MVHQSEKKALETNWRYAIRRHGWVKWRWWRSYVLLVLQLASAKFWTLNSSFSTIPLHNIIIKVVVMSVYCIIVVQHSGVVLYFMPICLFSLEITQLSDCNSYVCMNGDKYYTTEMLFLIGIEIITLVLNYNFPFRYDTN